MFVLGYDVFKKCLGEMLIFFKNSAKKYQKYMLGIYFI